MKYLFGIMLTCLIVSCAPEKPSGETEESDENKSAVEAITDPTKGIGAIKNVTMNIPLDQDRIKRGVDIYNMKCQACHKLDDKRVVGPGWKNITKRRKPDARLEGCISITLC